MDLRCGAGRIFFESTYNIRAKLLPGKLAEYPSYARHAFLAVHIHTHERERSAWHKSNKITSLSVVHVCVYVDKILYVVCSVCMRVVLLQSESAAGGSCVCGCSLPPDCISSSSNSNSNMHTHQLSK